MPGNSETYKYYDPSQPAAIVFAVLYCLTCAVTIGQYVYYKSWFWFFAVLASLMEAVGYIFKAVSAANQGNRAVYIVQYIMILIAPAVLAAACYMCMGRIALYVTPMKHRNIRTLWVVPRFMTLVFVLCDVAAFLIQVLGGILATSTTASTIKTGFTVLQIGLGVQIGAFGFFLLISFRFHVVSRGFRAEWPDTRWTAMLWAINAGSSMIFLRSIYRMIEFSTGFDGYLNTHEWNFYVFESGLIILVFAIYNVWHPAQYLTNVGWKQTDGRPRGEIDAFDMASSEAMRASSQTSAGAGERVRQSHDLK